MTVAQRMKQRRKEIGVSAEQLAEKLKISPSTVYRYENGEIEKISIDKLEPIAQALRTTSSYLMGWDNSMSDKFPEPEITDDYVTFPVIGEIAAGYDNIAIESWDGETIKIPAEYLAGRPREDYFVLKVKGSSMYPLYHEGDKVLILKQTTLNRSGEIGAILYDDEIATLKKIEYVSGEDWLQLLPINPEFQPQRIEGERLEHCRVIGVPRLLIREIK